MAIGHFWALGSGDDSQILSFLSSSAIAGFFIISGFLLTESASSLPMWQWLKRRVSRIFPGLVICVSFIGIVLYPLDILLEGSVFSGPGVVRFFLGNIWLYPWVPSIEGSLMNAPRYSSWNNSTWTLLYEFCCYIFLLIAIKSIAIKRIIPALLVISSVVVFLLTNSTDVVALSFFRFALLLGYFLLGVVVKTLSTKQSQILIVVIHLVINLIFTGIYYFSVTCASLLILFFANFRSNLKFDLRTDISYGIYLYHFPIFQIAFSVQSYYFERVFLFPTFVACSPIIFLLSLASWKFIEEPSMKLVRRHN